MKKRSKIIFSLILTIFFSIFFLINSISAVSSWFQDTTINASLPDIGSYSTPSVFYKDFNLYLVSGNSGGTFKGYIWNGNAWIVNSNIILGLPDIGSYSTPSVFYKDSNLYLIAGESTGNFKGFIWTGSSWVANSIIISGLPDVGSNSAPSVFYKDSNLYLISGNSAGTFKGYAWNGNSWALNTTITTGLPDIGSYSTPSVFYKDGSWYLLSGNSAGTFNGFTWNGNSWVSDLTINLNLPNIGNRSAPSVFYKNSFWYLISGNQAGTFNGYTLYDPEKLELQIIAPSTESSREVFAGENIPIYFNLFNEGNPLISKVSIDSVFIGGINSPIARTPLVESSVYYNPSAVMKNVTYTGGAQPTVWANGFKTTAVIGEDSKLASLDNINWTLIDGTTSDVDLLATFNFTINEPIENIDSIEVWVVAGTNSSSSSEDIKVEIANFSSKTWMSIGADFRGKTTRTATYTSGFDNLIRGNELMLAIQGLNMDNGESIKIDYVQIRVNSSSGDDAEYAYIPGIGWNVNVTVPTFTDGLKDLFVNATYITTTKESTEINAINYGVPPCTDTCSSLNYQCGMQTVCGVSQNCGTCNIGSTCQINGTCVQDCISTTCNALGRTCGTVSDGCSGTLDCGSCSTGFICQVSNGTCMKDAEPELNCGMLNIPGTTYTLTSNVTSTGTCFNITANDIVLDLNGYTITGDNSGADYGIYASGRNNITIKNGVIEWFGKYYTNIGNGIYLINTNNSFIKNIDSSNNGDGIILEHSFSNNLNNLKMSSNYFGGLTLDSSSGNTLLDISADSNREGVQFYSSNNNIITNLNNSKLGGITLDRSSNNIFNNINSSKNSFGLFVYANSNNNVFSDVITSFNGPGAQSYGIYVSQCTGNVFNNVISSSNKDMGIWLSLSPQTTFNNVTISDNEVYNTLTGGLYLYNNNNSIFNNLNCYNNTLNQIKANGWNLNINNTLNYNNAFGEIKFQQLSSDVNGTLRFGEGKNINIGKNFAFLNPSGDLVGLNIPANIILYNTEITGGIVFKDGAACGSSCSILSTTGTTYTFSVPGLGNYSIFPFLSNYGLLYNWYAVNDSRMLAAEGWHVPTIWGYSPLGDWDILGVYLGGSYNYGYKLKETGTTYWNSPNSNATNEFGFNGRGGGKRDTHSSSGDFMNFKDYGYWWSSTHGGGPWGTDRAAILSSGGRALNLDGGIANEGFSVRLIKDFTNCSHGQTGTYTGNDGKVYRTICIGTQEWLADNLAETKYRNGDVIPEITVNTTWAGLTTGALCAYNNDWSYVNNYEIACTDTCASLGYQCGMQTVCGNSIDCGTCNIGSTCQINGTCVINPPIGEIWSGELMTNGDFEFGNLTGWTMSDTVYNSVWGTGANPSSGIAGPQAGSYCAFIPIRQAVEYFDSFLYQNVSLSSYADSIDAGNTFINASGWGVSAEPDFDRTKITISFLFENGTVISTPIDTALNITNLWWRVGIFEYPIPVNTRYIKMSGSTWETNMWDSGSLDSFSVKIKILGGCTDTCSSLNYQCGMQTVCGNSVDCGSCGTGYYCSSGNCTICTTHASSNCTSGDVYWWNSCGQMEEIRYDCNSTQTCSAGACVNNSAGTQIIADHTIVDRWDDIPQCYIDEVKKMLFANAGESHSGAFTGGLEAVQNLNASYAMHINSYPDAPYSDQYLRVTNGMWGDYYQATGWVGHYGEEDWFTSATAIARTKAGIAYCNSNGYPISVMGFAWCYDAEAGLNSIDADPVYGVRWYGNSIGSPEGDIEWGLDAEDYNLTGNSVSMDSYIAATQEYNDYCTANNISTKVFFTTGPVDSYANSEIAYQGYLKWEYLREYIDAHPTTILFDYADILSYDDNGVQTTSTWNGHTYPHITPTNLGAGNVAHIGEPGILRIGKAEWWMLARIAGWDGVSTTCS